MGHFGAISTFTAGSIAVGTFTGPAGPDSSILVDGPIITYPIGSRLLGVYYNWTNPSSISQGLRFRAYVKDPLGVGVPWFSSIAETVMPLDKWLIPSQNVYVPMGKSGNTSLLNLTFNEGAQYQGVVMPSNRIQMRFYGKGNCLSASLLFWLVTIPSGSL